MKLNHLDTPSFDMIRVCPKCENITSFLLPDFEWKDGFIVGEMPIGYSCPACKDTLKKECELNDDETQPS